MHEQDLLNLTNLRRSPYLNYPMEVHIETLALCNAACSFCPYPHMPRKGERMPDALIDKIIDDLKAIPAQVPYFIAPFKVNDPLLDTRIFDVCTKINDVLPNANLRFFTNGSPLTDKNIEKIGKLNRLGTLWVSLNEVDPDLYQKLMQLPLDRTLKNLDRLHEGRLNGTFPLEVTLSRVVNGTDRDQAFMDFVEARYPLFRPFLIGREEWLGQIGEMVKRDVPPIGCWRWFELSIMATGKVALCCMDGEGKHVIGDVAEQSVLDVYNSPSYRKLRAATMSRKDAAAPCNTCNYD